MIQATETDMHRLSGPAGVQGHMQANVNVVMYMEIHIKIATCASVCIWPCLLVGSLRWCISVSVACTTSTTTRRS